MDDTKIPKPKKPKLIYTLLVDVGRCANDGLPKGCTGAALMCYLAAVDEGEAVREAVKILKDSDMAPLEVSSYGTLDERISEGHDIDDEERALMQRAIDENSIVIAQLTPFYDG